MFPVNTFPDNTLKFTVESRIENSQILRNTITYASCVARCKTKASADIRISPFSICLISKNIKAEKIYNLSVRLLFHKGVIREIKPIGLKYLNENLYIDFNEQPVLGPEGIRFDHVFLSNNKSQNRKDSRTIGEQIKEHVRSISFQFSAGNRTYVCTSEILFIKGSSLSKGKSWNHYVNGRDNIKCEEFRNALNNLRNYVDLSNSFTRPAAKPVELPPPTKLITRNIEPQAVELPPPPTKFIVRNIEPQFIELTPTKLIMKNIESQFSVIKSITKHVEMSAGAFRPVDFTNTPIHEAAGKEKELSKKNGIPQEEVSIELDLDDVTIDQDANAFLDFVHRHRNKLTDTVEQPILETPPPPSTKRKNESEGNAIVKKQKLS